MYNITSKDFEFLQSELDDLKLCECEILGCDCPKMNFVSFVFDTMEKILPVGMPIAIPPKSSKILLPLERAYCKKMTSLRNI